ncbi:hypothetical protein Trydic_g7705 [Trypoxylus dichotomus]
MSTAVSTHTGAGPLSLMSCVRESSPPQDAETEYENEKNVGQKKKRFWNKWFSKRKNKIMEDTSSPTEVLELPKESQRSRSTSELSETEEPTRRRNGTPMHPGLSVSHDSVFHSPHSGSEVELEGAQSSSSLSIHHQHHTDRLQTELTERLRLRRGRGDTSEDDEGLPRSPCNSPTVTDKTAIKDNPKSHSTCSEGSLLSVGSSEMDEDSFGQQSVHSSKLSLEERNITDGDFDLDLGLKNSSAPLNHSGARHKASVKPQRRYGAPRKKRLSGSVLPTTPEVNEEATVRSITPEVSSTKEIVAELYTSSTNISSTPSSSYKSMSKSNRATLTEKQLKCSSLPPGLAAPGSDSSKLNRSRSNAGTKYQEEFGALGEEDEAKDNKKTDSFLGRIFPRRSGKKRKSKEEKIISTSSTTLSTSTSVIATTTNISKHAEIVESTVKEFSHSERKSEAFIVKPIPVPRSGPASRQRIQPSDIPASPELGIHLNDNVRKSSPEKSHPASPLQVELENHFQQRLASLSASPKSLPIKTPPVSPKLQRSPLVSPPKSPLSYPKLPPKSHLLEKISPEHKVTITGLSAFQQRINANNIDENDSEGFKSLSDLPNEPIRLSKLVAKSQSFKTNNNEYAKGLVENKTTFAALASTKNTQEVQITSSKSIAKESKVTKSEIRKNDSLDNIKNTHALEINDQPHEMFDKSVKTTELETRKPEIIEALSNSNSDELLEKVTLSNLEAKELENVSADSEVNIDKKLYAESEISESNIVHPESKELTSNSYSDASDFMNTGITISGPRHKAIVSVTSESSMQSSAFETCTRSETDETKQEIHQEVREQQISVTKIQVKQESTVSTAVTKNTIPEFMNIQLHKVEKPLNNIILTTGFQSPKPEEEKTFVTDLPDVVTCNNPPTSVPAITGIEKPADDELQIGDNVRKFSKEEIEIIESNENDDGKKHVATAIVTITTMTPPLPSRIFKKNDVQIRKSLITVNNAEKPALKTKSSSLDIVESIKSNDYTPLEEKSEIKVKTQSANDLTSDAINAEPTVPLRRKSMANKQKQDDEPELMKVFARRSLKLKDNESESLSQQVVKMMEESNTIDTKSRDSDKENQLDSPSEERKKLIQKDLPKSKELPLETKFVETSTEESGMGKESTGGFQKNGSLMTI